MCEIGWEILRFLILKKRLLVSKSLFLKKKVFREKKIFFSILNSITQALKFWKTASNVQEKQRQEKLYEKLTEDGPHKVYISPKVIEKESFWSNFRLLSSKLFVNGYLN